MISKLGWKINRLRTMAPSEVMWRVRQQIQKKAGALGAGLAHTVPEPAARYGRPFIGAAVADPDERRALLAAADQLLCGNWDVFALEGASLGFPPKWNVDPKTGTVAPLIYGKAINYRDENVVGDIKYLWEPARHLELVTLALAWRTSGDIRYLAACRQLLQSWFQDCPYPNGIHWTSSLELAVRLTNWAVAWHLIGGADSPLFDDREGAAFRAEWLDSIYQHCHFIRGYPSRHSSANNHLFGEYMGLFVAALNWPCWPESAEWAALAKRGLEEEALRQTADDGVNREQAIYYQHEVMDMMLICHLVALANGESFSAGFMKRLELMGEFVQSLMDVGGAMPMIGDADDAQMVRLAYAPGWNRYRSLLASCALLFGRGDFKRKAGALDAKNKWLFGEQGEARWAALPEVVAPPRREYRQGGYWILGDRFDRPDEVRAVVDAGPLGYLSIAAHGHADALSLTLSVGGAPFLVDPGTFAYHTQRKWRDYFRGTSAHNTIRIDGKDQSVIGGNFMWLRKANSVCEHWASDDRLDVFVGRHDGYESQPDPVKHRRTVRFDKAARTLTVIDDLSCQSSHEIELFWHFAPACEVSLHETKASIANADQLVLLELAGPEGATDVVIGDGETPLGWYSAMFDCKVPCPVIRHRARIRGAVQIVTTISTRVRVEVEEKQLAGESMPLAQ